MSLYTSDNYWGLEHKVTQTKQYSYVIEGTEHEIIMCLEIRYDGTGSILNVDTRYWMHYVYDQVNGMTKDYSGKFSAEMDDTTHELFESYIEELVKNEKSK
jgi:hypothetical protein